MTDQTRAPWECLDSQKRAAFVSEVENGFIVSLYEEKEVDELDLEDGLSVTMTRKPKNYIAKDFNEAVSLLTAYFFEA